MITMMYDVLVIGSNMMELTTEIDRMPQLGETVAAPSFHMAFGGKGANQAVAAAKLGAKVAMISKVAPTLWAKPTSPTLSKPASTSAGSVSVPNPTGSRRASFTAI